MLAWLAMYFCCYFVSILSKRREYTTLYYSCNLFVYGKYNICIIQTTDKRIMLEIQTLLQNFLQTANVMSNYW